MSACTFIMIASVSAEPERGRGAGAGALSGGAGLSYGGVLGGFPHGIRHEHDGKRWQRPEGPVLTGDFWLLLDGQTEKRDREPGDSDFQPVAISDHAESEQIGGKFIKSL